MMMRHQCVQAPRVGTTQGLPLGHDGRSIRTENTLRVHLAQKVIFNGMLRIRLSEVKEKGSVTCLGGTVSIESVS